MKLLKVKKMNIFNKKIVEDMVGGFIIFGMVIASFIVFV
tara:strand:+ start:180 stop:296 length:117 start_codon:yes stop_codon:yes gene_type:complete